MRTYKNISVERRVWPSLQDSTGHTVELAPNDRISLDLPANFKDAHLVPVSAKDYSSTPSRIKKDSAASDDAATKEN